MYATNGEETNRRYNVTFGQLCALTSLPSCDAAVHSRDVVAMVRSSAVLLRDDDYLRRCSVILITMVD